MKPKTDPLVGAGELHSEIGYYMIWVYVAISCVVIFPLLLISLIKVYGLEIFFKNFENYIIIE
eukprot:Pgem_evm1s16889